MRKVFHDYFHIPEQGTIREKVFFARLTVSIVCIVLCLGAMGFNAYAYFTVSVAANANILQAATYSNDISVEPQENTPTPTKDTETEGKYTLLKGIYNITLTKEGNASTGYCRIDIGEGETKQSFYTKQIGVIDEKGTEDLERTIRIAVTETVVIQVVPCWGTYTGSNGLPLDETEEMILVNEDKKAEITELADKLPTDVTSDSTETETPSTLAETETPSTPTETETPSTPTETETPSTPTETETPSTPTETETPSTPTETETPSTPTEAETPSTGTESSTSEILLQQNKTGLDTFS